MNCINWAQNVTTLNNGSNCRRWHNNKSLKMIRWKQTTVKTKPTCTIPATLSVHSTARIQYKELEEWQSVLYPTLYMATYTGEREGVGRTPIKKNLQEKWKAVGILFYDAKNSILLKFISFFAPLTHVGLVAFGSVFLMDLIELHCQLFYASLKNTIN